MCSYARYNRTRSAMQPAIFPRNSLDSRSGKIPAIYFFLKSRSVKYISLNG